MHPRDTSMGGSRGAFPSTVWSAIEDVQEVTDAEANEKLGRILSAYWKPVYVCIRAGWRKSPEDAKDLTQAFFAYLLGARVIDKVRRGKGRFRGFLRAAVRNYLANQYRTDRQIKRGGDETIVKLDLNDPALEAVIPADTGATPEQVFDREWARSLLAGALDEFQRTGDAQTLEVLRLFEEMSDTPEGSVYDAVAAKLAITRDMVYHHLAKGRTAIRELIVARIKEYAFDDVEIQQELDLLRNAWS